jgi:hypothetical protein
MIFKSTPGRRGRRRALNIVNVVLDVQVDVDVDVDGDANVDLGRATLAPISGLAGRSPSR